MTYSNRKIDFNDSKIKDFAQFTDFQGHACERFMFMKPDSTYWDAQLAFERRSNPKRKRLAAIFVTPTGDEHGELLGMLTP